ncbi:hypothetical protein ACTNCI_05905 [Mitsuokella jalaludinii]|uniref:hypothetical protein n=1 Tax=Mitsuokella jalaludinii TaxID=187979 RepID=UPI003F8B6AFC
MENWKACEERMEKTAEVIQNAFDVPGLREAEIRVEKDEFPDYQKGEIIMDEQRAEMEKTAEAIRKAFRALDLAIDARLEVKETEYGAPHLSVQFYTSEKGESYDLPQSCRTIEDVRWAMDDKCSSYDIDEERRQYPQGEYGVPDEPYLTDELRHIRKTYERILDACEAADRVEKGEDPEKVYTECLKEWAEADRRDCQKECWDFMYRMSNLHNQSFEETMAILNQNYAKLRHGRQEMKERDPSNIRDDLLRDFRKLAEGYQSLYGVPDKDMQKAMKEVSKKLPNFAGKKPREDGGR